VKGEEGITEEERVEMGSDHHSHFGPKEGHTDSGEEKEENGDNLRVDPMEEDQFITKKEGSTKSIQHMDEEDENDRGNNHDQNYDESIISDDPIAMDELQSKDPTTATTMQKKMDRTKMYMDDDKAAMLEGTPTKDNMEDSDEHDGMNYPPFTSPPIHYDSLEEELLQSDDGGDYLRHRHRNMQETTDRRRTDDNITNYKPHDNVPKVLEDDRFITKRIRNSSTQNESSYGDDDDDHVAGSKLFTSSPPTDSLEEVLQSETSSSLDNMLNDHNSLRSIQKDECSDLVNIDLSSSTEKKK